MTELSDAARDFWVTHGATPGSARLIIRQPFLDLLLLPAAESTIRELSDGRAARMFRSEDGAAEIRFLGSADTRMCLDIADVVRELPVHAGPYLLRVWSGLDTVRAFLHCEVEEMHG